MYDFCLQSCFFRAQTTTGSTRLNWLTWGARLNNSLITVNNQKGETTRRSDVTDLLDKVVELLLGVGVFLGHLFVLGFPLVSGLLEGLDFAFVVAGFDVGLAEPVDALACDYLLHLPSKC